MEETISHLFYYWGHIQGIWNHIQPYVTYYLHFSQLTQQFAIFGFQNIDNNAFLIENKTYFYSNYIYTMPENMDIFIKRN